MTPLRPCRGRIPSKCSCVQCLPPSPCTGIATGTCPRPGGGAVRTRWRATDLVAGGGLSAGLGAPGRVAVYPHRGQDRRRQRHAPHRPPPCREPQSLSPLEGSQAKARQEAATRDRHLAKVREAFAAVERNLNRYSLKTHEAIVRRLEAAKAKYAEGELFAYELTQDRREQFHLQWQLDAKALEEWKLLEGVYVLKTSLPTRNAPLAT